MNLSALAFVPALLLASPLLAQQVPSGTAAGQPPAAATAALSVGESKRNDQLEPVEHAAWTGVSSLVFNLDEVITKQ